MTVVAAADANGHAAAYYRGAGVATVDTVAATSNGVTATASVTLSASSVTIGTPPTVQLAMTTTPENCWGAVGFPPPSVVTLIPADGSISFALCAFVKNSVTNVPIAGASVEFRTASGYFGASDTVATAATDAGGHAAMFYRGAGFATLDSVSAEYNGVAAFLGVTLYTPGVSLVPTPVPTPLPTAVPTPSPTPTPTPSPTPTPTTGTITGGAPPPVSGGFSVFVFGGGTTSQLVQAAGCAAGRAAFWVTNPVGEFVTYVWGTTITAVNAAWFAMFPNAIPPNLPMLGSCR